MIDDLRKCIFSKQDKPAKLSDDTMLLYFISALDVRIKRALPTIGNDEGKKTILSEVQNSYKTLEDKCQTSATERTESAWNEAYRIERLVALIEPADNLWAEVKRRLGEAAEENVMSLTRLTAAVDVLGPMVLDAQSPGSLKPEHESKVRSVLLDILEEIHWDAQRKFYSRPIRKSATRRIVGVGMVAFGLLILPYILIYIFYELKNNMQVVETWSWLPLYSALTAGLFGALFSRLLYLQQRWDTLTIGGLKDAREFTSILLRGCVGMTGAVIVSFFLQANVLGGGLFPTFVNIGLEVKDYPPKDEKKAPVDQQKSVEQTTTPPDFARFHLIFPSKDLALLVVWSFLAGFSERLVPTILQDTETSIGKKA
jgi:hypothetical protein